MTDLEGLIIYWQNVLDFQPSTLSTTIILRIEQTVKALKELKELKGE